MANNNYHESLEETVDQDALAEKLMQQPWNDIGNGSGDIGATDNFELIVDQLSAVFAMRLKDLVVSRPLSAFTFLQDEGHLNSTVQQNLRVYVTNICSMYRDVAYHSVEHAAHVTLSANKLLGMLLDAHASDEGSRCDGAGSRSSPRMNRADMKTRAMSLNHINANYQDVSLEADGGHEATFGISTDPMLRLALIFSALIHDVDHQGVPNSALVEEEDDLAIIHNDISVAEQNSLQVAFSLLAKEEFKVLKKAIMPDKIARRKFRQLVIEIVLATDISNPERMQINQSKWSEAFEEDSTDEEDSYLGDSFSEKIGTLEVSRKQRRAMLAGTMLRRTQSERLGIRKSLDFGGHVFDVYSSTSEGELRLRQHTVLDILMNTADIAHTMQSFDLFVKWNKRMFKELLGAFRMSRITWDPTIDWYANQIWFFDAYVIPLAEKLVKCGVFGSSGSVFLCFALENKRQWEDEGVAITEEIIGGIVRGTLIDNETEISQSETNAKNMHNS